MPQEQAGRLVPALPAGQEHRPLDLQGVPQRALQEDGGEGRRRDAHVGIPQHQDSKRVYHMLAKERGEIVCV